MGVRGREPEIESSQEAAKPAGYPELSTLDFF